MRSRGLVGLCLQHILRHTAKLVWTIVCPFLAVHGVLPKMGRMEQPMEQRIDQPMEQPMEQQPEQGRVRTQLWQQEHLG